jgi:glycosyltransferase involved in cell wall biosynthesis
MEHSDPQPTTATGPATPVVVEVTNTVTIDFTSGLQRVVREVVRGLDGPAGHGLELVPVTAPVERSGMRRLTDEEREHLAVHPPGGRAGRRADDFGAWSPVVRRLAEWDAVARLRAARAAWRRRRAPVDPALAALALGEPAPGSVFFDIEASWQNPGARAELLPRLRAGGVHTAVMVADVMPELFPDWFDARLRRLFRSWLTTHLEWTELFLTISERTAADLRSVAVGLGVGRDLDVRVVPLGADFPVATPEPVELPPELGRYLLVVGTLEPRKNQQVVLDAFDRLRHTHADVGVVLVGREGWLVGDLVRRIRTHPEFGRRLLWFGGIGDAQLAWLYRHAFLSVCPSRYEGLGVPVMEALHHRCPTIASTRGALPEAGAGFTEDVDPDDLDGLVALVDTHLRDDAHHRRAVERLAAYRAPSWVDTAAAVGDALRSLAAAPADLR